MRIESMKHVVEVYEIGSINKAAQQLFISQSSLSASIKALESEFGEKILDRSHKGVSLTEFGEHFMDSAKKIIKLYDQITLAAKKPIESSLKVSCQFLRYAGSIFAEILSEHGGEVTHYSFIERARGYVCQDVLKGSSEIGIIVVPSRFREASKELLHSMGLDYNIITTDQSRCMIGKGNPYYHSDAESISLEQLSEFPIVRYETSDSFFEKNSLHEIYEEEFPNKGVLVISGSGSLQNILEHTNGFFIGIYNKAAYAKNDYFAEMRAITIADYSFEYDTVWVKLQSSTVSNIARDYLCRLYCAVGESVPPSLL